MDKILSIAEITEIEQAYRHGAPSLGKAAQALALRWDKGLRDSETAIRLIFLVWYSCSEPEFLTGLDVPLPTVDSIIGDMGGLNALTPEQMFVLGVLASSFQYCLGDEAVWKARSTELLELAARAEPTSRVFRDWRFFAVATPTTLEAETLLYREIHARFHGRGAFGDYMTHILAFRLKPSATIR